MATTLVVTTLVVNNKGSLYYLNATQRKMKKVMNLYWILYNKLIPRIPSKKEKESKKNFDYNSHFFRDFSSLVSS